MMSLALVGSALVVPELVGLVLVGAALVGPALVGLALVGSAEFEVLVLFLSSFSFGYLY